MQVVAVPVKSLHRAKTRLGPVLSAAERAVLTLALLEDVLDACQAQPGWETAVVSADETVLEVAARRRARTIAERGTTLLEAVRQIEADLAGPRTALAVVLGDLPYLTPAALAQAFERTEPVVAAPADSDGGTNLLIRRPPGVIPARFGRASFAKHRWAARRARVGFAECRAPGLARDLDTPEDLAALAGSNHACRSARVCAEMGLAERLRTRAGA
jgi:2-phospho-L-lactate guanylyltransferase